MLKLITLNIENKKHYHRFTPFLEREQADIVCLQEVLEADLEYLATYAGTHVAFAPYCIRSAEDMGEQVQQGVAIFSRSPFVSVEKPYFFRSEFDLAESDELNRDTMAQPLLVVRVEKNGTEYTVATTHFMKSYNGAPDDFQRARMPLLLDCAEELKSAVICGDFNIPRDTELYHVLCERYTDHVPREYTRSLDPELHRRPDLEYMVDYIWSTPDYVAENVRMVCGLSDHCAIVGEVRRLHTN